MTKSKGAANATKYDPCKSRPYNRYNIYYILERERFLQSNSKYKSKAADACSANIITGYEDIGDLPSLPPQYAKIELSSDWYMPGKRKLAKRDHKKSHGVASFQEIARKVADGWRSIDASTLEYCTILAKILKQRHIELKKTRGLECYAEVNSSNASLSSTTGHDESPIPKTYPNLKQSCSVTSISTMADYIVSSSDTSCNTYNTTRKISYSSDYCDDDEDQEDMPGPSSMSSLDTTATVYFEVDIPDKDIMAMWFS